MAAHEKTIPELDAQGLRNFGLTTGAIIAVLFGLLFPWLFERDYPIWPWIVFSVLALWGLLAPLTLSPVYRIWMKFGLLISRITTPLVLGIVFFIVIAPIGLLRKLMGKDSMSRAFDVEAISYRVPSQQEPRENLENPY